MNRLKIPFSMDRNFRARREFVLYGKKHQAGDPIARDGLTEQRLRQMFDNRMIEVSEAAPAPAKVAASAPAVAPAPAPVAAVAVKPAQIPADAPKPAATGALQAVHRGFGRWFVVDAADVDVAGPLKKEEALARAGG
jgi:hypothetical protein